MCYFSGHVSALSGEVRYSMTKAAMVWALMWMVGGGPPWLPVAHFDTQEECKTAQMLSVQHDLNQIQPGDHSMIDPVGTVLRSYRCFHRPENLADFPIK